MAHYTLRLARFAVVGDDPAAPAPAPASICSQPCAGGEVTDSSGATYCTLCPLGTFAEATDTRCTRCRGRQGMAAAGCCCVACLERWLPMLLA